MWVCEVATTDRGRVSVSTSRHPTWAEAHARAQLVREAPGTTSWVRPPMPAERPRVAPRSIL